MLFLWEIPDSFLRIFNAPQMEKCWFQDFPWLHGKSYLRSEYQVSSLPETSQTFMSESELVTLLALYIIYNFTLIKMFTCQLLNKVGFNTHLQACYINLFKLLKTLNKNKHT